MSNTICPYPGLRPFNEEESIFFKGREQQVERLVKRLEEKKFLMVNGASGDGKSSLIYAGVIPYAKAGFFKAKYNNWIVADFRPERSPLKNLTTSLCKQFKIDDHAKTEKELGYGFSALCDLYKRSSFYIDETTDSWQQADEKERKALKRKGANLLVLVDQFEEFFTNPENYQNGIPSIESQRTVNLLLETYKLAAAQQLPIYVVCTMRSDYIGQCAAFRGLPEAIGYSQFFVPRLKRQEIEQVIEGPAELAGCKISKRLTQTLLNSITEGFDQLPILQHALNHIWKMADNGQQEMDLIHLAKVGGLSAKLLNPSDRVLFNEWYLQLPAYKQQLFERPSLNNVLDAHANELYLTAHLIYEQKFEKKISEDQAQRIIKIVFQCLTKIDSSRAVRNRMTLQEITNIINDKNIDALMVDRMLQIYRQQGNTFLQPFVGEHGENEFLSPESVLDITHESLIRNWKQLTAWANEEFENLQNYLDFSKQLQRWVQADFNKGYLLPIGPLTFFENWFNRLNPSKYWIKRYEEFEGDKESQLSAAANKMLQAQSFIKKSAGRLFFSRTLIKYGGQRIASIAGILLLIIICTYYYFDYRKKQNDYVLNNLLEKGGQLLQSKNVDEASKAEFLIDCDRLNELSGKHFEFSSKLDALENDTLAFDIGLEMFKQCTKRVDSTAYDKVGAYSFEIFRYLFDNFEKDITNKTNAIGAGKQLIISKFSRNRINQYLDACRIMKYNSTVSHKAQIDTIINRTVFKVQWYLTEAVQSETYRNELVNLDFLYTVASLIAIDDQPNFSELIQLISPFETDSLAKQRFNDIFKRDKIYKFNCVNLPREGGYHLLEMLYATQMGTDITAKQKLEMLLDSSDSDNLPIRMKDLFYSICKSTNVNELHFEFVINKVKGDDYLKMKFLDAVINDLMTRQAWSFNYPSSSIGSFISKESVGKIFDYTERKLLQNTMTDSTKMNLALFYKKKGIYTSDVRGQIDAAGLYYTAALTYFTSISDSYKFQLHYYERNSNLNTQFNYQRFLVMGFYNENLTYFNNCGLSNTGMEMKPINRYNSSFINFLLEARDTRLYHQATYCNILSEVVLSDFQNPVSASIMKLLKVYQSAESTMNTTKRSNAVIALYDVFNHLANNNNNKANYILDTLFKMKKEDLMSYDLAAGIAPIAINLAKHSENERCMKLLKYVSLQDKNNILLKICYALQDGEGVENTYVYLNELLKSYNKDNKIGMSLYRIFGKVGGYEADRNQAPVKYRNTPELMKPKALDNWVAGTAESGNYYKALKLIPSTVSETKELDLINRIIKTEIITLSHKQEHNSAIDKWNDRIYFDLDYYYEQSNFFDVKLYNLE